MSSASIKKIIPCKKNQLIKMVLDIEKYPEFVPWCIEGKIHNKNESKDLISFNGDLKVGKINIGIFAEINNLFNTKRLSLAGFYNADDQLSYFQSLHLPESSAYQNIIGSDRIGEFRDDGVEFQPIAQVSFLDGLRESDIRQETIYFESPTDTYQEYESGTWVEVSRSKMANIIETNAYIDMPNQTSFNFLNPRNIFMGLRISYDF